MGFKSLAQEDATFHSTFILHNQIGGKLENNLHKLLKKRRKMTAQNGHPCTEWFSSLYLQTNRKHMENQSLICTRKTSFYMDNITSTLTIVVFSIKLIANVCPVCTSDVLQTRTENFEQRKTTASLRNHRKRRVCSDPCICTTQRYSCFFFQRSVAGNLKNISPIVWYCCNIWRPYKIANILYKTNEKAVSFFIDNIRNVTWPFPSAFIFPAAWRVFVWKHRNVCCSLLQWCDVGTVVWCRTCTVRFF